MSEKVTIKSPTLSQISIYYITVFWAYLSFALFVITVVILLEVIAPPSRSVLNNIFQSDILWDIRAFFVEYLPQFILLGFSLAWVLRQNKVSYARMATVGLLVEFVLLSLAFSMKNFNYSLSAKTTGVFIGILAVPIVPIALWLITKNEKVVKHLLRISLAIPIAIITAIIVAIYGDLRSNIPTHNILLGVSFVSALAVTVFLLYRIDVLIESPNEKDSKSEIQEVLQERFAAKDANELFLKLVFRPLPLSLFTFVFWLIFNEWYSALFVGVSIHLLEIIAIYRKYGEAFTPQNQFGFYFRGICVSLVSAMILSGIFFFLPDRAATRVFFFFFSDQAARILLAIPLAIASFFILRAYFLATKLSRREEEGTLLSGVEIQKRDILETYQEAKQEIPIRKVAPPKFDED